MTFKLNCIALAALAAVPLFAYSQEKERDRKPDPTKIGGKTLIAANELKWIALPGIEGAQQALVVGDPTKEAHRAFYRYPAGLKSPPHHHSNGDRGVVISGALGLAVEGAPVKKLGPGSFFSLGADVAHITSVEGPEPCVFYIEREGAFDVVLVEGAGSKAR